LRGNASSANGAGSGNSDGKSSGLTGNTRISSLSAFNDITTDDNDTNGSGSGITFRSRRDRQGGAGLKLGAPLQRNTSGGSDSHMELGDDSKRSLTSSSSSSTKAAVRSSLSTMTASEEEETEHSSATTTSTSSMDSSSSSATGFKKRHGSGASRSNARRGTAL
jgi:hypothetical protein